VGETVRFVGGASIFAGARRCSAQRDEMPDVVAFEARSLAVGLGFVWATDFRWPLVVRVDPATRVAEPFASIPAAPRSVSVGLGAVWALSDESVIRVEPSSRVVSAWDLPWPATKLAVGSATLYLTGYPGNGELLEVQPAGVMRTKLVGASIQSVAVGDGLVWVFDDAAAEIVALDEQTLDPVRAFPRLSTPGALVAAGKQAWHAGTSEMVISAPGERQRRSSVGHAELVRMDAATGDATNLGPVPSQAAIVLDSDTLWIVGQPDDLLVPGESTDHTLERDPTSRIRRYDCDGRQLAEFTVTGQVLALAVADDELWVDQFRRSRQADVLSVLGSDGAPIGEVDLTGIDVTPWWTPPEPPPRLPINDFVTLTREMVDADLRTQRDTYGRFGERWQTAPVSDQFQLDTVALDLSQLPPRVTVTFRWNGEQPVFAVSHPVDPDDDASWPRTPDEFASSIVITLEECLLSYGLDKATRENRDGVVWLSWDQT
jgi:hypothetical protein